MTTDLGWQFTWPVYTTTLFILPTSDVLTLWPCYWCPNEQKDVTAWNSSLNKKRGRCVYFRASRSLISLETDRLFSATRFSTTTTWIRVWFSLRARHKLSFSGTAPLVWYVCVAPSFSHTTVERISPVLTAVFSSSLHYSIPHPRQCNFWIRCEKISHGVFCYEKRFGNSQWKKFLKTGVRKRPSIFWSIQ